MVDTLPKGNLSKQIPIAINNQVMDSNPVATSNQVMDSSPVVTSNQDTGNSPVATSNPVGTSRDHMELHHTEPRVL